MSISAQQRAEKSAAVMWAGDAASKALGIVLQNVSPGEAIATLDVEARHLNGHDICHGGFIFTLADTAFAFACNSYNLCAVAQHNSISFIKPGKLGQRLSAHAKEISRQGRSGVYDVTVSDETGQTIALFRGNSRAISGNHFQEDLK